MKKLFLLFMLLPTSVWANVQAEVGAYSNFIWRGTTFSENRPAIQGEVDAEGAHGFYLGTFVSNAEFSDPSVDKDAIVTQEIDLMIGKRWRGQDWEIQVQYTRFLFPGAGTFDTDELNLMTKLGDFSLELSYMADYFGYETRYYYIRLGYEWTYWKSFDGGLFIGYNQFSRNQGRTVSNCLDDACTEVAEGLDGAGSSDYVDIFFANRKTFKNQTAAELSLNWTNRKEYSVENGRIIKDQAKDFAAIVAFILPFTL